MMWEIAPTFCSGSYRTIPMHEPNVVRSTSVSFPTLMSAIPTLMILDLIDILLVSREWNRYLGIIDSNLSLCVQSKNQLPQENLPKKVSKQQNLISSKPSEKRKSTFWERHMFPNKV
ncbi:hypothetical protein LEP1GSC203_0266 [Leptospira terpstrae serovar Hualin str. LT 11-33 = ATCC 700639]|uniref:Uncharacterized protein n=1 Tax=Leptospira terpstrae serovar Hualin str. LT 11-33 = ATCC 700639 TaxID=1257025 RepID=N1VMP8_9LEPT|nr:hypothetical protein LEP1GSC203_0266 [Leptospira terpstrae serovar Hualin str. LT 11-33 = ATCC 700639]